MKTELHMDKTSKTGLNMAYNWGKIWTKGGLNVKLHCDKTWKKYGQELDYNLTISGINMG